MGKQTRNAAELIYTASSPQHLTTQDAVIAPDEHEHEQQSMPVPALAGVADDTLSLDAGSANAALHHAAAAGSPPASGGHHASLGSCTSADASADGRAALAELDFDSRPADRCALDAAEFLSLCGQPSPYALHSTDSRSSSGGDAPLSWQRRS